MKTPLLITEFTPTDQEEAKTLILAGMEERWEKVDFTLNPDLNDIAANYANGLFLVARLDGRIVGTGAFKQHNPDTVEIVRMSVAKDHRRKGIARQILIKLIQEARLEGYEHIILETTASWQDAIAFYHSCGFRSTHIQDGDIYFEYDLSQ